MLTQEEVEQTLANLCVLYEKATGRKATVLHCHPLVLHMFMVTLPPVPAGYSRFELEVKMERELPPGVFYVSEG